MHDSTWKHNIIRDKLEGQTPSEPDKCADEYLDALSAAGFATAAKTMKAKIDRVGRLARAYEHYRYVTPGDIDAFNKKLREEDRRDPNATEHMLWLGTGYRQLVFTASDVYTGTPPKEVLDCVQTAVEQKIFDRFEVASVERIADPIVFGIVDGCPDKFYIAEWGDDVSINDILGENDG